jgi:alpha-tubulin suppressor-like RCC1 family protein
MSGSIVRRSGSFAKAVVAILLPLLGGAVSLPVFAAAAPVIPTVTTGGQHSCSLNAVGVVSCWGGNFAGQSVPPTGTFSMVSAGDDFTCGIRSDSTLACWGNSLTLASLPPSGTFTMVSAGPTHACGVRTSGTISCWGTNSFGAATPPSGTFTMVSVGDKNSCGVRTDATIACWGFNDHGQSLPPTGSFTTVVTNGVYPCGLRNDATIACWGDGSVTWPVPSGPFTSLTGNKIRSCGVRVGGALLCWGDPPPSRYSPGPLQVPTGTFTMVSAGGNHQCAVRSDDVVVCWGDNESGQTTAPSAAFARVEVGLGFGCGLRADKSVQCWGNGHGQEPPMSAAYTSISVGGPQSCGLRIDARAVCKYVYVYAGLDTSPASSELFQSVDAGSQHACGVRTDLTVLCWGSNDWLQLLSPTGAFASVSAGENHSCGVRRDQTMACWGNNVHGQATAQTGTFTTTSAGTGFSCGLRTDATLVCWGYGGLAPITAPAGTFLSVSAGDQHACGVRTDGSLQCWGSNLFGERNAPTGVFTSVSAGSNYSCGVRTNGVFQCWGKFAALGDVAVPTSAAGTVRGFSSLSSPARLLDTRSPGGRTVDGQHQAIGRIQAGSANELAVLGRGDVPIDATAVSLNVTVVGASNAGFLTVFPFDGRLGCTAAPDASNLNFGRGETIANAVLSKVGSFGSVCLYASAEADVLVDVSAFMPDFSVITLLDAPARALDTRSPGGRTADGRFQAGGRLAAGVVFELPLAGRAGVPGAAFAASLNVTVVGPSNDGYLTVFPCGSAVPEASNLNFTAGSTIPNLVIVAHGGAGRSSVCLYSSSATDVLVDVSGYLIVDPFANPLLMSRFRPLAVPSRLLDSRRPGGHTVDGQFQGGGRLGAQTTLELPVASRVGIPIDAEAVSLNVTVVSAAGDGFLTVYPCGTTRPDASNVNFTNGQTIPNVVLAKVGAVGKVCLYTSAATDVIVDVSGYLVPA